MAIAAQAGDKAWFVFSDSPTPPAPDAGWEPVQIPDKWTLTRPDIGGSGWYHIQRNFEKVPSEMWAVMLERVDMNAAFFVGDHFLGDGGSFEEPVSRNWIRPLLFRIPPALLHIGNNDFYIRVHSYPNDGGGLEYYHIGPYEQLEPKYDALYNYYITSSQVTFYLQIAFSFLLIVLWIFRKKDMEYLWLAAAGLMGSMFSLNMFLRDIPMPQPIWEWFVQISMGWFIWFNYLFAQRYLHMKRSWFERSVSIYALIGSLILMLIPTKDLILAAGFWQAPLILIAIYVLILSAYRWWQKKSMDRFGWLIAYSLMFSSGIHDWTLTLLRQVFDYQIMFAFHLGTSALVLMASMVLVGRFIRALNTAESLNLALAGKVDRFEAEQQQHQAIQGERSRIMRDLHDGLGNSLVSAMALSMDSKNGSAELQATLKDAMSEMRMIVGSASHSDFDFNKAMLLIKERTASVLASADIMLEWNVVKPEFPLINVTTEMHIVRIVQECISNALKHAQPTIITVFASVDEDMFRLEVFDNGIGIADFKNGNGLNNLQSRADEINAILEVNSYQSGTNITLLLPL